MPTAAPPIISTAMAINAAVLTENPALTVPAALRAAAWVLFTFCMCAACCAACRPLYAADVLLSDTYPEASASPDFAALAVLLNSLLSISCLPLFFTFIFHFEILYFFPRQVKFSSELFRDIRKELFKSFIAVRVYDLGLDFLAENPAHILPAHLFPRHIPAKAVHCSHKY